MTEDLIRFADPIDVGNVCIRYCKMIQAFI